MIKHKLRQFNGKEEVSNFEMAGAYATFEMEMYVTIVFFVDDVTFM